LTTQRRVYRVTSISVDEINQVLNQMADRLDQMEGFRGTPAFKAPVDMGGNRATNAGAATETTDLTQFGQMAGEVSTQVSAAVAAILTFNKPVGTIHCSVVSANPHTYLGYGTWVAFGAGRVMVGINPSDTDFDTVQETGGAKTTSIGTHTHSTPAHTHPGGTIVQSGTGVTVNDGTSPAGTTGPDAGGSVSTVQPYVVVFMWLRTA
jgi:hypothetical protein